MRDLQEDKLAVVSKSVVIATTPSIARQVASSLARHDTHIQEANQAKDLDLCVQCNKTNMAKRWANAGRQMRRLTRGPAKWTSKHASARL